MNKRIMLLRCGDQLGDVRVADGSLSGTVSRWI